MFTSLEGLLPQPILTTPDLTAPDLDDSDAGDDVATDSDVPSTLDIPDLETIEEGLPAVDDDLLGDATAGDAIDDGAADGDSSVEIDESAGYDQHEAVTMDDLVAAATRLSNLMDPSSTYEPVDVVPADGEAADTLEEQLALVVARYSGDTAQYPNGRIPAAVLCPLSFSPGNILRCDAAERMEALSVAFEERFGRPISITDSYRSYEQQVAVKAEKPYLAGVPGTSNHGWGLAVDLGGNVQSGRSAEYVWLRLHGPDYGWDNPTWARSNGSKPEPWHFEFFGAGEMPDRFIVTDTGTEDPEQPATPPTTGEDTKPVTPSTPTVPPTTTTTPPTTTPPPGTPGPTDPATPTDPTTPTDPGTPTEPTDPTDPGTPTDPTDPTDPAEPTDPGTPRYPGTRRTRPTPRTPRTRPILPSPPTGTPTDPTDPSTPTDPADPTDPPSDQCETPDPSSSPEQPADPASSLVTSREPTSEAPIAFVPEALARTASSSPEGDTGDPDPVGQRPVDRPRLGP